MDRARLEARKLAIEAEIEQIKADVQKAINETTEKGRAAIYQRQGQIAMLNEMLALPDPDDVPILTGETAPEG